MKTSGKAFANTAVKTLTVGIVDEAIAVTENDLGYGGATIGFELALSVAPGALASKVASGSRAALALTSLNRLETAQDVVTTARGAIGVYNEGGVTLENGLQLASGIGFAPDILSAKVLNRIPSPRVVDDVADNSLPVLNEFCFAPDTKIKTPSGSTRIDQLGQGDVVMAFDFSAGDWVPRPIVESHISRYRGAVVSIGTQSGDVVATAYHPFWVIEGHDLESRPQPKELTIREDQGQSIPGRWVNSHDLFAGDVLISQQGQQVRVLSVSQRYEEEFEVRNLTIQKNHSFAVGPDELLVHNTNGCRRFGIDAPNSVGNQVFRGDSAFSATVNAKGIPKSFIDDAGNLVPASTTGIYKGRQVTVGEHVLGGFRRGAKGNSPFTSLTPNASTAAGYGSEVAGVNISALRQAIRSGDVTGVAVLSQRQIQRLIRNNPNLSDYWKNLASKWAARDGEFLIRGTVPERFIIRGGQ